ncbi:probable plastidic glucose transporter 1 [Spinacia oleracea]|uniref:Probable plastidic glucose transporter 1 n=1 Tax=Spinacia oleracea TaxID=3562 RepID=A0ABM3R8E8_SPIOL|nr:probable plastidic glucose transporter 1 [Spinacia oleracea]
MCVGSNVEELSNGNDDRAREIDFGWLPSFPHALIASMANFLFGYHIGLMNGPIVSVARELGFEGNSMIEGLVVSIFIVGAFIGSLVSGSLVDKFGCRRTLQIDTVPLITGVILSAQAHSVNEVLWGRFLVGLGIGVNTVLVPIYISESRYQLYLMQSLEIWSSPLGLIKVVSLIAEFNTLKLLTSLLRFQRVARTTKYRGSLVSLCQIGTCLRIIASLFIAIPAENDPHW